ncbi:hypothetical protein CS536_08845 [Yersinia kristensenii]|nr:hypothetical protein CS536_08845 [Yersinia kristensenii]
MFACLCHSSHLYPIDFKMQEGGKRENPDELTSGSDSGARARPTHSCHLKDDGHIRHNPRHGITCGNTPKSSHKPHPLPLKPRRYS